MRIGILGGTFNPVHSAHVQMARISRDEAALDRVLLMVAADPPHKRVDGAVPAAERYSLVRRALENEERIFPSDLEILRGGKSYTLDTLLELRRRYSDAELFLIVGSDTLGDLPNWYKPEEVLKIAGVLCVPRLGMDQDDAAAAEAIKARFGARIRRLSAKAARISSTQVRDALERGEPVSGLLPEAVEQAVYESGLYFPPELRALQAKCREALSEKRYAHTAGTMRAAASLAKAWGLDPLRARTAALLHDCAKCLDPVTQEVLSGDETGITPVCHAFAGAVLARTLYGVTDDAILRAVRLHTTGDEGMTDFDALVYAADLIEPNRTFSGVDDYRARVPQGPDAFMLYALDRTNRLIGRKGWAAHPATTRALRYYEQKAAGKDPAQQ